MFLQIPRAVKDSYSTTSPPPPDSLGGDHRTGPWQRTGAVGEEGPAHPDDTHGGELQPRWGLEIPGCRTAVMRRQEGRSNPH